LIDRAILIVLDSVGAGFLPDAAKYNDAGVNTLGHIHEKRGHLNLPNTCGLGIGRVAGIECSENQDIIGCYGKMAEASPGKDTTTGHWEMTGVKLDFDFPTYLEGFPSEIINEFEKRTGTKIIGNYPQSGTVIINELGDEHLNTGNPIVYTSADSVFQIAAHEDVIPLEKLYELCRIARDILVEPNAMARVIARPFTGTSGSYKRNEAGRKDFSLEPISETLLDIIKKEGLFVAGVGKIGDIFAHRGLTDEIKTKNNMDGVDKTLQAMDKYKDARGLIMTNLVEFDSVYGHRRDLEGYGKALEEFDRRLPEIIDNLDNNDILIITADHGCDPSHELHTDHTREYVPLLIYGKTLKKDVDLGTRNTFADCGQTVADFLGVRSLEYGTSFKKDITDEY
jgi:phosphopentomutase